MSLFSFVCSLQNVGHGETPEGFENDVGSLQIPHATPGHGKLKRQSIGFNMFHDSLGELLDSNEAIGIRHATRN